MTVLEWDKVGEKTYQGGIDRGVLYLQDGTVAPWNGLTSVEDNTSAELKSFYLDGLKILDHVVPGDFEGKLSAFTYPEEFDSVQGISSIAAGLLFHDQEFKSFNLSYRTKIGNDLDEDYGYKIHLFYNLRAVPDAKTFETIGDQGAASQFSWTLSGIPPISSVDIHRPTAHVVIDSTSSHPGITGAIEEILYGTENTNPRFPTIVELKVLYGQQGGLYIIDNGNGTWTALDPDDIFITMLDANTFEIDHADATYLDPDTYEISSTEIPLP